MSDQAEARRGVVGWPEYEVSDAGNVYRVTAATGAQVGRRLKPTRMSNGYLKVALCRNSKRAEFLVHRLVAEAFIGLIPRGMDVCHNDGRRDHNAASNLRIDTRAGNMRDALMHGTLKVGSAHPAATMTEGMVSHIRARLASGEKVAALSAEYGIPAPTLWNVKRRANWKHV